MQDQNQPTQNNPYSQPAGASVTPVVPGAPGVKPADLVSSKPANLAGAKPVTSNPKSTKVPPGVVPKSDFERRITDKIQGAENILVALSRDPSVDEMAAAIGLTLYLDGLQKHTTAIYSGQTPDALQFLQPEQTFERNTDSLQDFIIALNKDKADHLRYKLEGDFVKVYITPYKTVITEKDLEFSRGDYNVDLVIALGVPSGADLDEALSEYGRIMHDATTVDITTDVPGRFGEIEWSDPGASSVCEMVARLLLQMRSKDASLDKEVATALLTGIVAATGRFSNDRTSSETLQLASKLMSMGADQQLISAHVMDNDLSVGPAPVRTEPVEPKVAEGNLLVGKDYEPQHGLNMNPAPVEAPAPAPIDVNAPVLPDVVEPTPTAMPGPAIPNAQPAVPTMPLPTPNTNPMSQMGATIERPVGDNAPKDYAAMIDEALAEPVPAAPMPNVDAAMMQSAPEMMQVPMADPTMAQTPMMNAEPVQNPDADVVLPPAPVPPAGMEAMNMPPVLPSAPVEGAPTEAAGNETMNLPEQPVAEAQPAAAPEPGAFRIPGM